MTTILDDPIALYIQENATFKLHFVLIVLPCKQQNVTYTRFFKLICTERRHITKHTQLINIPNNKNFVTKWTHDPQLRTIADECTLDFIVLRHFYVHVCYIRLVNVGFHTAGRRIWVIDVCMNVICVKTGLDWRNVRFKMGRIRKKENNMTARLRHFGKCRPHMKMLLTTAQRSICCE